jgi:glutamate dehydrogenase/leucine dehydrogenase
MARMTQKEIDEISDAFGEAWEDFFGQEMYYIAFDCGTYSHPIYREAKRKQYKEEEKTLFHGTLKEEPLEEKGDLAGKRTYPTAELTFVTKELRDKGVLEVDTRDIIEVTDINGNTERYNIINNYGKVQLVDNRIFTKLKVVRIR